MEKAILDKLMEIDKKIDKQTEELKEEIIGLRTEMNAKFDGVGDTFFRMEKAISEQFEKGNKEIKGVKKELKKTNKKIDMLYESDILNKKMLNDHENRIVELEWKVSEESNDSYNDS